MTTRSLEITRERALCSQISDRLGVQLGCILFMTLLKLCAAVRSPEVTLHHPANQNEDFSVTVNQHHQQVIRRQI